MKGGARAAVVEKPMKVIRVGSMAGTAGTEARRGEEEGEEKERLKPMVVID
jgi:hypothetical protein